MERRRVLVIDDEALITDSFRLVLEAEGYTVEAAASGSQALAAVDANDWDCAFVDVVLPDMDGLELLRQIRARRPGLPAVVITGHGSGLRGFAAREAGAYAFLEKPGDMTPEKILSVLATALARRRAQLELEAARHQVAMSEKLSTLGTLVSGVAHEIRTPLTYVTNNLFLIRQRLEHAARSRPELGGLVDEVVRYGKAALDGVARIDRLVEDLRRFAKRDEGGPEEADLRDVVGVAVDLFRATRRGRIDVRAELRSVPSLRLDTGQVQQVVLNLLTNAAEAMPSGGLVRIATRAVPGGGEIEVEDHGDGIAPDVQDRLFHPFFTTKAEGTGLGLSISHRIIESHGGHIRFESHVERGTTFFVFLPLREADRRELSA